MNKYILALLASAAILPSVAHAQDTGDQSADDQSRDIIVTAQRYEQRLQDVPLAVSVVGAQEIASRGAADLADLQYSIPGFSSYEYGLGRTYIQMRGISNTIGSSTIGIYLDETPLALDLQGAAISVRLLDLERVEVLRGPQATLYGQGSMGGTIRYIPAAPKLDAVGGSVDGEYSSTKNGGDGHRAVGVLNLPIVNDKLGVRLVAGHERIGGYIDNVVSGERNVNRADVLTLRGTLLAKPSDRLTVSLMGLYQKSEQDNPDFGVSYKTTAVLPAPTEDRYTLIQGKMSYDLDFAELSASAGYIDRDLDTRSDLSGYYVPALNAALRLPVGFITQVGRVNLIDYTIHNGEIRLSSQGEGPLRWQFGATYRDLKSFTFIDTSTAPGALPIVLAKGTVDVRIKSYALYGELSYAFTPQLIAIAGARYFSERKHQVADLTSFGTATHDDNADTFNSINPRFNLSYAFTPNAMIFANVAKGFRSGGFNFTSAGRGVFPVPPSYEPDEIWTYELGTKHQLFGNKLILDASLYRTTWSKVQSYNLLVGSPLTIVNNAGHVQGWGVDLSVIGRPTRDLTLTATYGWNNLKFDKATADKAKGDPIDGAVRQSWSASLDYRPPLTDDINGIVRLDYQHAGKGQLTVRNFPATPVIPRPGRDLVNMRIGADFGRVEVALFADNLFNETAPNIVGPFGVLTEDVEQRPRVLGISASAKF